MCFKHILYFFMLFPFIVNWFFRLLRIFFIFMREIAVCFIIFIYDNKITWRYSNKVKLNKQFQLNEFKIIIDMLQISAKRFKIPPILFFFYHYYIVFIQFSLHLVKRTWRLNCISFFMCFAYYSKQNLKIGTCAIKF